jgi:aryl-alcohol dehydrogenase-like predicted oxidoreductase
VLTSACTASKLGAGRTAAQIVEAQWAAQRAGSTPFISLQAQYSLLARAIEAEILPVCQRHGLGTLTWSPLGGGVLAGRYPPGQPPGDDTRIGRLKASPMPAARRRDITCHRHDRGRSSPHKPVLWGPKQQRARPPAPRSRSVKACPSQASQLSQVSRRAAG